MDPVTTTGAPSAPAAQPAPTPAPAPASATDAAVQSGNFKDFRAAKRAERAGTPLATPSADSSPAAPATPAASTDATPTPASEPGKPAEKKADGHKGNAETRVRELLTEQRELKAELARLRAGQTQPPPTPNAEASSAQTPAPASTDDPKPDPTDATKYPDGQYDPKFIEDLGRWAARDERRTSDTAAQTKARETARTEASRRRDVKFTERMDAAKAADPEFLDSLSHEVKLLRPTDALGADERITARNALADEILSSDVAPDLLRHFSDHPEDLRRFDAMGPRDLLREFTKLETAIQGKKPAAAPPKHVSSAPPPPPRVDGKGTTPADPVRAAVEKGDFAAFRAAKRQRLEAQSA